VALPDNARTGSITVEAYVGDGFSGPYIQSRLFQVVAGPATWYQAHPRVVQTLPLVLAGLIAFGCIALALVWLGGRGGRPRPEKDR
jgi:hypothetical protein